MGSIATKPNIIIISPTIPMEKLSTSISIPGLTLPSYSLSTCFIIQAPSGPIIIPPISIVISAPMTTPIVEIAPITPPLRPYTAQPPV